MDRRSTASRLLSRRGKDAIPRLEPQVNDFASRADRCVKHHSPFDSALLRCLWIDRLNHPHQALSGLRLRNAHLLVVLVSCRRRSGLARRLASEPTRFHANATSHDDQQGRAPVVQAQLPTVRPPGPSPAVCSARTAWRRSESRSCTPDTSWWSDQVVFRRDSSAQSAYSRARPQRNKPSPRSE